MALTKKQELDIAYQRKVAGEASEVDEKNLNYAKEKGIWSPPGGESLEGTLLPEESISDSGAQTTNTTERTLGDSSSQLTSMKSILQKIAKNEAPKDSVNDILNRYKASGVNLSPQAFSNAMQTSIVDPSEKLSDKYQQDMESIVDIITRRDETEQNFVKQVVSEIDFTLSGKEYNELLTGNMSDDLKTKIAESDARRQSTGVKTPTGPTMKEIEGEMKQWDDVNKRWINPPMAVGDINLPIKDGDPGGQCGSYLFGLMGEYARFGDSLKEKVGRVNKSIQKTIANPQVGDILVFDPGTPNGHVAAIIDVNGNMVTVTESNWSNDNSELVGTRTFDISEVPGLMGSVTGGQFKDEYIAKTTTKPKNKAEEMAWINESIITDGVKEQFDSGARSYDSIFLEVKTGTEFINDAATIKTILEEAGITEAGALKPILEKQKNKGRSAKESWDLLKGNGDLETPQAIQIFKDVYGDFEGDRPGFEWFGLVD